MARRNGRDTRGEVDILAEAIVLADASDSGALLDLSRRFAGLKKRAAAVEAGDVVILAEEAAAALRALAAGEADAAEVFTAVGAVTTKLRTIANGTPPKLRDLLLGARRVEPATPADPAASVVLDAATNPLADDPELTADFIARATEHMEAAERHLMALENAPEDVEALNELFRCFHTLKGMAGFLSLDAVANASHEVESVLEHARSTRTALDTSSVEDVFAAIDRIKTMIAALSGAPATAATAPSPAEPAAPTVTESSAAAAQGATDTVRIDARRLDLLLETIGELVIAEAMVNEAASFEDGGVLRPRMDRLRRLTREMQDLATSLRMITLRTTFLKMSRVVRDTARRCGKAVDLVTSGEDTELDKAVVDAVLDPLIHLLRNAVDHGIETDEAERTAAGKPAVGRIELRAFHRGGSVYIEVADDGRGIDVERVLARGLEQGLVAEGEEHGEQDIVSLVFQPGFSTAEKVTDLSGRGVGMDVVRAAMAALQGAVEVETTPGEGTTIRLRLPLTLAVIDGMVVRVSDERYVVPTLAVVRSLRPESGQVLGLLGAAEVLRVPDGVIQLIRLGHAFGVGNAEADPYRAIAVIVEDEGRQVALLVDELLGQQSLVIKSLSGPVEGARGLAGAAILPDGRAGLIVNVSGLVRLVSLQGVASAATG